MGYSETHPRISPLPVRPYLPVTEQNVRAVHLESAGQMERSLCRELKKPLDSAGVQEARAKETPKGNWTEVWKKSTHHRQGTHHEGTFMWKGKAGVKGLKTGWERQLANKGREKVCNSSSIEDGKAHGDPFGLWLAKNRKGFIGELRILESPSGEQWRQEYSPWESLYLFQCNMMKCILYK